jgi:hypothetical protein
MQYHIYFSDDPFDLWLDITIPIKGDHPTLGMQFTQCEHCKQPRLMNMAISTPGSRIPKWRSQLWNAYLVEFNHQPIHNVEDAEKYIREARERKIIRAPCKFVVDKSFGVHPQKGVPQLYFDQLITIAQQLYDISKDMSTKCNHPNNATINHITPGDRLTEKPTDTTKEVPTDTPNTEPTGTTPSTKGYTQPHANRYTQYRTQRNAHR